MLLQLNHDCNMNIQITITMLWFFGRSVPATVASDADRRSLDETFAEVLVGAKLRMFLNVCPLTLPLRIPASTGMT